MGIMIAGGGTGGHLFPGLAVGAAFRKKYPNVRIHVVGAGKNFERLAAEKMGFGYSALPVRGFKKMGAAGKIRSLKALLLSIPQAVSQIRAFWPWAIIGVGGYASVPTVAAGRFMGVFTAIHEQNRIFGLANRILMHLAHRVYVSFSETAGAKTLKKTRITGNPVRPEFTAQIKKKRL